jgi:hypothetical protein
VRDETRGRTRDPIQPRPLPPLRLRRARFACFAPARRGEVGLGPRSPPSIRFSGLRSARVRIPAAVLSWRCRVCRFGGQGGDRNGRAGVQGHLLLLHPRAAPREHAPRQRRCRCVLYSLPLMLHARSLCMLRCALPRLLARYGTRECFPLAISGGCISLSDRPFRC